MKTTLAATDILHQDLFLDVCKKDMFQFSFCLNIE